MCNKYKINYVIKCIRIRLHDLKRQQSCTLYRDFDCTPVQLQQNHVCVLTSRGKKIQNWVTTDGFSQLFCSVELSRIGRYDHGFRGEVLTTRRYTNLRLPWQQDVFILRHLTVCRCLSLCQALAIVNSGQTALMWNHYTLFANYTCSNNRISGRRAGLLCHCAIEA